MGTWNVDEALVQRQIELEQKVIDGGITKFREAVAKEEAEGHFAETLPGRWLISNFIDPVAQEIRTFVKAGLAGRPQNQAVAVPVLNRIRPDQAAYITVRTIVNTIIQEKGGQVDKSFILHLISRSLREEICHAFMKEEKPKTYKYWMEQMKLAPEPLTRQRMMRRLKANFVALPKFGGEGRVALMAACEYLFQAVRLKTDCIRLRKATERKDGKVKTVYYISLSKKYLAEVERLKDKAESLWPAFLPMVCPPRPWTGAFKGGFIGPLGERTTLIRASNRSYLEDIHNNAHKIDKVLRALNAIQATPWRINRRICDVLANTFTFGSEQYALPSVEETTMPERPDNMWTDINVRRDYVNSLKNKQRLEAKRVSQFRAVTNMLIVAKQFRDEKAIWFAHNLDWRGRVYPMASYLSPQGEELSRALLEFADGLPLETDEAVEWLAVHGAGCWGYDKVSFADRVQWVRDHEMEIRSYASDPIENNKWTKADKPWMFLAWCFDWVGYLEKGKAHVSHLPVAMDGSCNGLQNFAAMLRHEETARAVNLVPSELPSDIYQQVADKVTPRVQAITTLDPRSDKDILHEAELRSNAEYADSDRVEREKKVISKKVKNGELTKADAAALNKEVRYQIGNKDRERTKHLWRVLAARWLQNHITRKLVKRPVMTYPYSVTLFGIQDQLVNTLLELNGKDGLEIPDKHVGKAASMLKTEVFEAIQETVVAAAEAMRWLRSAAEVVAESGEPVQWLSPIGLKVVQHYWESTSKYVSVYFGGQQYRPLISFKKKEKGKDVVSTSKQASGVAPNFVHSCDASHLMFTVLGCKECGFTSFHMIHDSYGTHARHASTLAAVLRREFIRMYSGSLLDQFRLQLASQVGQETATAIPPPPEQGNFDVTLVQYSRYFFA